MSTEARALSAELAPAHQQRLRTLVRNGSMETESPADEVLALCGLCSIIEAGGKSFTGGVTPLAREVVQLIDA